MPARDGRWEVIVCAERKEVWVSSSLLATERCD